MITAIPAVHIFLVKDDRVLLQRRYNTGYEDGNYSVPAGHVDAAETVSLAAARELLEETGISVIPESLEMIHVMHRTKPDEAIDRVDFFFRAQEWSDEPVIAEPEKCDQLCWASFDQLPDNVVPYIRFALEQMMANNRYSEFGW
jgi:8-oxo-dGTP pyrophosphatase MutT (NUDIX family)